MTGSLRVILKDKDSGELLSGIPVTCRQTIINYEKTENTGSDGQVQFDDLKAGEFVNYIVNSGGYHGYEELRPGNATVYEGQITVRRHDLEATNGNGNGNGNDTFPFKVHVKDRITNDDISGAYVTVTNVVTYTDSKNTNSNGNASFQIPTPFRNTSIKILATKEGYDDYVDTITIQPMTHEVGLNPVSVGQGFAKVISVSANVSTAKPGEDIAIKSNIKNTGEKDRCKVVVAITDTQGNIISEHSSSTVSLETNEEREHEYIFTIPANYTQDTIKGVGIGFHREG